MNILNLFKQSFLAKTIIILAVMLTGEANFVWAKKALPYSYGFEGITSSNNGLSTEGWTLTDCYNSSYSTSYSGTSPYALSSGGYAGSNAFRFYPNGSYAEQCLISPELAYSSTGIEVSFHYRSSSSSNPIQTFNVGYSSTDATTSSFTWGDEISYKSTTWETYKNTFPAGTKYIAIKYTNTTTSVYLYLDDFEISLDNPYKTPTNFTLSSYDATSATFTWGREDDVTAFQMQYIKQGDADSTTIEIGNVLTKTLNELSTDKEYKAKLRSNYGGGHYSEWTEEITFIPREEIETTINALASSTSANNTPFNGNTMHNNLTRSQFIIPSASLSEVNSRQITKITFYTSSLSSYENVDFESAEFEVYLQEVSNATFSSTTMGNWGTKVKNSSTVNVSGHELNITLDTPFNYGGGNLQVGFKQTVKSKKSHYTPWYYVTISNSSRVSTDDGSATIGGYSPKMTITSVPITNAPVQMDANGFTTFASPYPLDLTTSNMPDSLTAYRASVDAENSKVRFTSDINQTVVANTGILLKGKANKTYNIPVAASGTPLGSNALLVNSTGGTFDAEDGYTYFAMKKNSDPLTFGTFDPSAVAIPSNKAYLKVILPSGARTLRFVFDDNETTGIKNVDAQKTSSKDIYFNLNGQRVAKPTKGMYMSNGKKYIVK